VSSANPIVITKGVITESSPRRYPSTDHFLRGPTRNSHGKNPNQIYEEPAVRFEPTNLLITNHLNSEARAVRQSFKSVYEIRIVSRLFPNKHRRILAICSHLCSQSATFFKPFLGLYL